MIGGNIQALKEDLYNFISDASKDAQGFRARIDISTKTVEDLRELASYWSEAAGHAFAEEREAQEARIADFEQEVQAMMAEGADRDRAIRWILDSRNLLDEPDVGYVEYSLGLPYGHLKDWRESNRGWAA